VIDANSTAAMAVAALLVGTWLGWKLWQRRRFRQWADIPYISRLELEAALMSSSPPLVIDLRGPASVAAEGKLDTAVPAQMSSLLQVVASWPKDAPIVTLCACPQDATAVLAARALTKEGFLSVRPLRGSHLAA
jgi:rhodanese-related sulfurtransferase